MVAVGSATLCCKPGSLGLDERSDLPEKASDSKATSHLKPTEAPKTQAKPSKGTPVKKAEASTSGTKPLQQRQVILIIIIYEKEKIRRSNINPFFHRFLILCISFVSFQINVVIIIQVLVLNVGEEKDKRLSLDWKLGENLDFTFVSMIGEEKNTVKAHKSIVLKYSPQIQKIMKSFEERGIKRDC